MVGVAAVGGRGGGGSPRSSSVVRRGPPQRPDRDEPRLLPLTTVTAGPRFKCGVP